MIRYGLKMNNYNEKLGQPAIKMAGLNIWIHGRQFPDSKDYWDANWLNVTVRCEAKGSSVLVNGNIIHLPEISHFLLGVEKLYKNLKGKAEMACMEPELSIELETEKLGHLKMSVNITPDHLYQKHNFVFEIDQSFLPKLITECKTTLEKYPVVGKP